MQGMNELKSETVDYRGTCIAVLQCKKQRQPAYMYMYFLQNNNDGAFVILILEFFSLHTLSLQWCVIAINVPHFNLLLW